MFTKIRRAEERPRRNRFIEHSVPLISMVLVELSTKLRRDYMRELCDNRFFLCYCLRFEKLIFSSKAAIEMLEKFLECLKLDTRASSLDPRCSIASSIEDRVSSRDCQLTFALYCTCTDTSGFEAQLTYQPLKCCTMHLYVQMYQSRYL